MKLRLESRPVDLISRFSRRELRLNRASCVLFAPKVLFKCRTRRAGLRPGRPALGPAGENILISSAASLNSQTIYFPWHGALAGEIHFLCVSMCSAFVSLLKVKEDASLELETRIAMHLAPYPASQSRLEERVRSQTPHIAEHLRAASSSSQSISAKAMPVPMPRQSRVTRSGRADRETGTSPVTRSR